MSGVRVLFTLIIGMSLSVLHDPVPAWLHFIAGAGAFFLSYAIDQALLDKRWAARHEASDLRPLSAAVEFDYVKCSDCGTHRDAGAKTLKMRCPICHQYCTGSNAVHYCAGGIRASGGKLT